MKTDEQIEKILVEAPQGAIEYCLYDYGDETHPLFLNCENQFYEEEWVDMLEIDNYFHSRRRLSDLREILTLRQRVRELGGLNQEVVDVAPDVQREPVGWHTEDHLDDKSATTYSAEVAQRWRDKGWPVWPLYTTPQPAPDVGVLVEALDEMIDIAKRVDSWESFPSDPIERAEDAIRAYRKKVGEL